MVAALELMWYSIGVSSVSAATDRRVLHWSTSAHFNASTYLILYKLRRKRHCTHSTSTCCTMRQGVSHLINSTEWSSCRN